MSLKVLVTGTFDRLHAGHRDFFRQAAQLGAVYAIVARDQNVHRLKQHLPKESERTRLAKVSHVPEVTQAKLGHPTDFFALIGKIKPAILALGFDQKRISLVKIKQELRQRKIKLTIKRLKAYQPHKFKTSLIAA